MIPKKIKTIKLLTYTIILLLFGLNILNNINASEGDITLSEATQVKTQSESFVLKVYADTNNKNAGALNFSVNYDSSKVMLVNTIGVNGIEKGVDTTNYILAVNPSVNSARFALTTFSNFSSGNNLHIATLNFITKPDFIGSTNINIVTNEITDDKAYSLDLSHSNNSGAVITSTNSGDLESNSEGDGGSSSSGGGSTTNSTNSSEYKTDVWLSPNTEYVGSDSEVSFNIHVNTNDMNLGALNFNLNYDSSKIILDNTKGTSGFIKDASLNNYALAVNSGDNTLRIGATTGSNYLNSSDLIIGQVNFKTREDFVTNTSVTLNINEITDDLANRVLDNNITQIGAKIKYKKPSTGGNGGLSHSSVNSSANSSSSSSSGGANTTTGFTKIKAIVRYPSIGQIIERKENEPIYIVGTTKPNAQISIMLTDSKGEFKILSTVAESNGAWKIRPDISEFTLGKVKIDGVFIDSKNLNNKIELSHSFTIINPSVAPLQEQEENKNKKDLDTNNKELETKKILNAPYSKENIIKNTHKTVGGIDYKIKEEVQSCTIIDNLLNPLYDDGYITELNDIYSNKYRELILRLERADIIHGDKNKDFNGKEAITRSELLAILLKVHCYDFSLLNNNVLPFQDVTNQSWQYKVVKKAYDLGIAKGDIDKFNNRVFRPNDYVSRAEAMALILNMGILHDAGNNNSGFIDLEATWQEEYLSHAVSLDILNNNSALFKPQEFMTRNDFIKYLFNTIKLYR